MAIQPLRGRGIVVSAALALGVSPLAAAQTLPDEPLVFADGRITVGADVSATFSCADAHPTDSGSCSDDTGFFNYTDYEHSSTRMVRVDLTAAIRATNHVTLLGEVRSENAGAPQPYGLYLRIRPWTSRAFDIQVGRVPPAFGGFSRRTYPSDNLLIGYPLAYQYLTSLRADALPANADELMRMRGRGWLSSFSLGNPVPDRGLALVSAFRWDTGIQAHAASEVIDGTIAVTTGTLGNPLVEDDNRGKQVVGRVSVHATPGLKIGVSAARGPFVKREASEQAGATDPNGRFTQTGLGADVEYSRNYYLIRFETIVSDWRVPVIAQPAIHLPLRAVATLVEGRYKIRPGLYAAARFDHLGFSEIAGTTRRDPWDAPVSRLEIGAGLSLQRNLLLKLAFQHNTRAAGRVTRLNLAAAQIVYWL